MVHPASSKAKPYSGADRVACIQLWSLHEQCHLVRNGCVGGGGYLLYLLACAFQYRYIITVVWASVPETVTTSAMVATVVTTVHGSGHHAFSLTIAMSGSCHDWGSHCCSRNTLLTVPLP
jgi:hypothetical protein